MKPSNMVVKPIAAAHLLKFVVLGTPGAKTDTLISKFVTSMCTCVTEIGKSLTTCDYVSENTPVRLHIWKGDEAVVSKSEKTSYGINADAFIIMGHTDPDQTITLMGKWMSEIKKNYPRKPLVVLVLDQMFSKQMKTFHIVQDTQRKIEDFAIAQRLPLILANTEETRDTHPPFRHAAETLLTRINARQHLVDEDPSQKFRDDISCCLDVMTVLQFRSSLMILHEQAQLDIKLKIDFCEKVLTILNKKWSSAPDNAGEWFRTYLGTVLLLDHYQKFTSRMAATFRAALPFKLSEKTVLPEIERFFQDYPTLIFPNNSTLEPILLNYVMHYWGEGRAHPLLYYTHWPLRGRAAVQVLELCEDSRKQAEQHPGNPIDSVMKTTREFIDTKEKDPRSQAETLNALNIHYLHMLFNHTNFDAISTRNCMIEFLRKRVGDRNAIVDAFLTTAAKCMSAESAVKRQSLSIFIIYLFDLRNSVHYREQAEEVYQKFLRSKNYEAARKTTTDYAVEYVKVGRSSYGVLMPPHTAESVYTRLEAHRALVTAMPEFDTAELFRDINTAVSRLKSNFYVWGDAESEKIVRILIQILTLPTLNLPFANQHGLPEFMLDLMLQFSREPKILRIFSCEYFTAPFRDNESLKEYRTRVALAGVAHQYGYGSEYHPDTVEYILAKIYEHLSEIPHCKVNTIRGIAQGKEYYAFLEHPTDALRAYRAAHPLIYYFILTEMNNAQTLYHHKTKKIVPPPSSIPIIRAYLNAAKHDPDFSQNLVERAKFLMYLSQLPQADLISSLTQISSDALATFILQLATKEDFVRLTDCLRLCLQTPEGALKVSSAFETVLGSLLNDIRKTIIHFLLSYFDLVSTEDLRALSGDENPRQLKWIAEKSREYEKTYSMLKLEEIASREANHTLELSTEEKLQALRIFEAALQRGVTLDPINIRGVMIPAPIIMMSQLGSVIQCQMTPEEREGATQSLREVAIMLYTSGNTDSRTVLLSFIAEQITALQTRATTDIALSEALYAVITLPKQVSESVEAYIRRLLIGFVINDTCAFLPNEKNLQKFIAWRLTVLPPEQDKRSYGELTRFGDPHFVIFNADAEKYFQDQARCYPERYLYFLHELSLCYGSLRLAPSPAGMLASISEYLSLLLSFTANPPTFIEDALRKNDPTHLLSLLTKLEQDSLDLFVERFAHSSSTQLAVLFPHFSAELLKKLGSAFLKHKLHINYFELFIATHVVPLMKQNNNPFDEQKIKKLATSLIDFYRIMLDDSEDNNPQIGAYLSVLCNCIERRLSVQDNFFDTYIYELVLHPLIQCTLNKFSKPDESIDVSICRLLTAIISSNDFKVPAHTPANGILHKSTFFLAILTLVLPYGLAIKHLATLLAATFLANDDFGLALTLLSHVSEHPKFHAIAHQQFWPKDPMLTAATQGAPAPVISLMLSCGFSASEVMINLDKVKDPNVLRILCSHLLQINTHQDQQIAALSKKDQVCRPQVSSRPTSPLSDSGNLTMSFKPAKSTEDEVPDLKKSLHSSGE